MPKYSLAVVRPFLAPWEIETFDELEKRKIEVFYISTAYPSSSYESILRELIRRKQNYILPIDKRTYCLTRNTLFNKLVWFRLIWPDVSIGNKLVQTIKNLSPDVVDTLENYTLSSYLVTSQRYTLKAKTVVTSWENVVMPFHRFVMRYLVNLKTNKFRALTNSAKLRLIKEKVSEEKISVIPPAINIKKFSPGTSDLREKLNLKGKRIILYVGRLIKQKGVIELILAMKLVKKVISDATLLLVGGGPLEETVKKLSTDLNLEESIRLYGPVPHESMPEVYRVADVLVLPSIVTKTWMEQFGYVLAEAMATGIPVVASNCGAIPELVKHEETGLLAKPGDPIDLAQRIIEILKNDELKQKVRENGMKYVRKYYSLEEVVPKLDNFYLTLVQAKR